MSTTLEQLKATLAALDVPWREVGSSNPAVACGYFERTAPRGVVLQAPIYLDDKDEPMHPDLVRFTYRRLEIVYDAASLN